MAKYMLIMRADDASQRAFEESGLSFDDMLERMGRYNDSLIDAGVLVAAEGLDAPEKGVVVDYSGDEVVVTDGPYGETKELFNGYWILQVDTIDDAVAWARKAPLAGPGVKAEIRRVPSIDEFPQDNEWVRRERAWRERTHQL
ncbi:YciI family protein [Isoptericola sp. NPDC057653]|jgi:hypothetical protein|uniref:YciI family protein n=1 Tax=unclassified Isoptericola TaxID=2623355 RepID=UPI0036A8B7C6